MKGINSYVLESGESRWQALRTQKYTDASIDPDDIPRHWHVECLRWEIYAIDMRDVDLSWANLSRLDIRGVDLRRTGLQYACTQLANADIEGATFRETNLAGANLDEVTLNTKKTISIAPLWMVSA